MSCECPTPEDTPCLSPYFPDMQTPMVKMYLGERVDSSGQLELFTSSTEDFDIQYSVQQLIDSGILPADLDPSFLLSERELLTTGSYETWISFVSNMYNCGQATFGSFVINAIGYDMTKWSNFVTDNLTRLSTQDNSSVGTFSHYFRFATRDKVDIGVSDSDRNLMESKLILCYQWLRQIYENFYGKKFLVKIGEPNDGGLFSGVCVKDEDGNYPSRSLPFVIDGDGSPQGLYVSDEVSTEGGMLSTFNKDLLKLNLANDSAIFRTDDGRLDCFVRFCTLTQNGGNVPIQKFGAEYTVDISKLSPDNYVISRSFGDPFAIEEHLFIKANAANKLYIDTDGQWVLVTLSQLVSLLPLNSYGNYRWAADMVLRLYGDEWKDIFNNSNESVDTNKVEENKSGSLNNSTVLNMLVPSETTIFPEAFAIPMKSNILRYGPYYAGNDDGGGVEVEYRDEFAPWKFFDVPTSGLYEYNPVLAYNTMDYVAQQIVDSYIKDNLILEKGKITVAGIPEYNLGDQYTKIGAPVGNDGGRDAQPLLTDISISYGASGFTTTYNFSTFSPRFGNPEKYILDQWSESIKGVQTVNRYLREERLQTKRLANTLKSDFAGKQIASGLSSQQLGPKGKTSSTPNKLLLSGYYLSTDLYDTNSDGTISAPIDINKPDRTCNPCGSEPPVPSIPGNNIYPSPNIYRQYAWAETHESYQDEYIQDTFYQLSIMSLDGMFLPVSLKGNPLPLNSSSCDPNDSDYRLPRFAMRQEDDGSFVDWYDEDVSNDNLPGYPTYTKSRSSMPPFKYNADVNNTYNLPITQKYLNPILSASLLSSWDDRLNNSVSGFVISSIAFGCTFEDYQLTHSEDDENIRQQQDNFRFSALRGPLVLQGWGYDTNGKPIPNKFDIPKKAESGKFKKDGLADAFMENWLENPKTWPVGPVDLRFDRDRGVWTCASPNKIIVARLKEKLSPYGKAEAELINPSSNGIHFYKNFDISGPDGENIKQSISSATIDVYDFLGINLCECDIVYAYYDDNRYIVLESNKAYGPGGECQPCTVTPSPSMRPSPSPSVSPSASPCWAGLEILQTLRHYDPCKTQALIHKDGCLMWEDIVQCDPVQNAIEKEKELECREYESGV